MAIEKFHLHTTTFITNVIVAVVSAGAGAGVGVAIAAFTSTLPSRRLISCRQHQLQLHDQQQTMLMRQLSLELEANSKFLL